MSSDYDTERLIRALRAIRGLDVEGKTDADTGKIKEADDAGNRPIKLSAVDLLHAIESINGRKLAVQDQQLEKIISGEAKTIRACLSGHLRMIPSFPCSGQPPSFGGGAEEEMWTEAHRARHEAKLKDIVSLQMIGQLAAWLERADPPQSAQATPTVKVVGAIWWHLRTGAGWRALPGCWPHWRTVYGWFRRWQEAGLFDVVLRHVARLRRRARGRVKGPRLAVIDTQSVKCIPVRGPRGYDAAKKVVGRKRVALVDADGTWLAVAVVPANIQDRDCLEALSTGKEAWPSLRVAVLDGAFTAERCKEWCHLHGLRHHLVERHPEQKGFVVLERRWVVERSFGFLTHWAGLLRDRAGRLDVSIARLACVAVMAGLEAIINPLPAKATA